MRTPAAFVGPGAGTRLPCVLGAFATIASEFVPIAWGGSSASGIIALAAAAGRSFPELEKLTEEMLTRRGILDLSLWPPDRFGIYKGDVLYKLLDDVFEDRCMADLKAPCRVVVANLWRRRREVVSNESHPLVLCRDAAYCTAAIPLFFKARRLRPNDATLYVDGGTVDNVPHALFDDMSAPTIGVRFSDTDSDEPRPVRGLAAYAAALFDLRQDAANATSPSRKRDSMVCVVRTKSDGLQFDLDVNEVRARYQDGVRSGEQFLANYHSTLRSRN